MFNIGAKKSVCFLFSVNILIAWTVNLSSIDENWYLMLETVNVSVDVVDASDIVAPVPETKQPFRNVRNVVLSLPTTTVFKNIDVWVFWADVLYVNVITCAGFAVWSIRLEKITRVLEKVYTKCYFV